MFGFEIVDLSVPVDTWHMEGNKRYLDADWFAERLAPQISQLGVHYMSAIVDEWMACDIADYLMDEDSHEKPPRDCPNYYNPQRKLEVLTGRQKFCKLCTDKLRAAHPEEFKALNMILAAFD